MSLPNDFEIYLKQEHRISGKTLRNYRADLLHFTNWSTKHLCSQGIFANSLDEILPHFSGQLVANYKGYHLETRVPESTINRRLSTLRNFGRFLDRSGKASNPTGLISNVKIEMTWEEHSSFLLTEFEGHLKKEKVSKATLKNYLSDVKQFLAWIKEAGGPHPVPNGTGRVHS